LGNPILYFLIRIKEHSPSQGYFSLMFRELQTVLRETHQSVVDGLVGHVVERELLSFREHICASAAFCDECMECHRQDRQDNLRIITDDEMKALLGS
jgi:hypothetical protein